MECLFGWNSRTRPVQEGARKQALRKYAGISKNQCLSERTKHTSTPPWFRVILPRSQEAVGAGGIPVRRSGAGGAGTLGYVG